MSSNDLKRKLLTRRFAFLCYTGVVLFFFPRGRVSQQIENNSELHKPDVADTQQPTISERSWVSDGRRLLSPLPVGAVSTTAPMRLRRGQFLGVVSLSCRWSVRNTRGWVCADAPGGTLRSYAPRLNVACRAAMFYPIFVLTSQQKTTGVRMRERVRSDLR